MEFVIEKSLTNARPPKSNEAELITTPTEGNMRLTEAACEILGVGAGDYVALVKAKVDGDSKVFIYKGKAGDDENTPIGAKLGATNKMNAGSLLFSSANAYQTLEGNSIMNRHYTVAEQGVENGGTVYHEVTFKSEVAKAERKASEEAVQA